MLLLILIDWENEVFLSVYSVLSNVIEFNNLIYLTEVAKNIIFFINFNIKLSELWDFEYEKAPFSNFLQMTEFVNRNLLELTNEKLNISLNKSFEFIN